MRLPNELPLVRADAKLVEQALGNVVGNAVVHTRPETHILIDANVTENDVALRVIDDGPGIAARDAAAHVRQVCPRAQRGNRKRRRR